MYTMMFCGVYLHSMSRLQNTGAVKSLMIGDEARHSHVVYLQYSSVEIQAKRGGRRWKIYGCPVCYDEISLAYFIPRLA